MSNDLLTAAEAAELLKLKKNTVYEMIKRGELPSRRIGKQFRIARRDIEALTGQTDEGHSAPPRGSEYEAPIERPEHIFRASAESERENIFILSGQDMSLDIMANDIGIIPGMPTVLRSQTSSYNGLYKLYCGSADVCTVHLWDEKTKSYNIPYIEHMLPGMSAVVARLFGRMTGLYVKKGNPLGIRSWEDLGRGDVKIVNREAGSGTRVLLDSKLKSCGIKPSRVPGYDNVKTSHFSVASAVSLGEGDVGVGMQAVGRQNSDIEFIPQQKEWVDIVFFAEQRNPLPYRVILDYITSERFMSAVRQIGDYDFTETGRIFRP